MKQFPLPELRFFVAKVVKNFGSIAKTTETLDEFRYRMLRSVAETGRGGENNIAFARFRWSLRLAVSLMAFILMSHAALAQAVDRNAQGLYELKSPRLTLVTDIPIDDELKSWPGLVEHSLNQWQLYFDVSEERLAGLKVHATLIGDRPGLTKLGLLDGVPGFDEGYQHGNRIYVREQPTIYFRRHLFLHELTHWIVWELYGGGGSPWFMEGMAEMQATHLMSGGKLMLCMIPATKEQVPGWGRLRMLYAIPGVGLRVSFSQTIPSTVLCCETCIAKNWTTLSPCREISRSCLRAIGRMSRWTGTRLFPIWISVTTSQGRQ